MLLTIFFFLGLLDSIYGNNSLDTEELPSSFITASPPGASNQSADRPSVVSPLSAKEHYNSMSLTPPNSPNANNSFQQQHQQLNMNANHNNSFGNNSGGGAKDFPREISTCVQNSQTESIDLQIDYWTLPPKANEVATNKKTENCKFTLKNSFRNLQISRLPSLGEGNSPSLALYFIIKEKKQKSKFCLNHLHILI